MYSIDQEDFAITSDRAMTLIKDCVADNIDSKTDIIALTQQLRAAEQALDSIIHHCAVYNNAMDKIKFINSKLELILSEDHHHE